ncbi:hypothetical protein [Janthinobacterium sp. UMAB-56]|uniref:hypothetical protein n=1 Tax=Janthinobacterium sp. UMAB-56 TaxID=1365361 RepID=UPI001C59E5DC|nr:hypothetical protein [Janthinobacterium sp. UMAB-56]
MRHPGQERTALQLAVAACSDTWRSHGKVVRGTDALGLVAILQHAGKRLRASST